MPLFRPESFRTLDGLYGDVQQMPSVSWKIVGSFLLASLVVAVVFLSIGSRNGFAIITGEISDSDDAFHVSPIRSGIVDRILVREGQSVLVGSPLARIRITTSNSATTNDADVRTLLVTAARVGTVTGITAHPGDFATPGVPLLSIVPATTRLEAALDVPSEVAGLVQPGQPVRIAVDAFPYQTFGTVEAHVRTVSHTMAPGADGRAKDVFVATAPLARETIAAYGRAQPLRPGMTVSARIETGKRSLAGWLFDPVLAVARR